MNSSKLRLRASDAADEDGIVMEVAEEAALLRAHLDEAAEPTATREQPPETTLLVLSAACVRSWLGLVELSWRLQEEAIVREGHAEHLQIVLFHPEAVHSAYAEGPPDAADYSIRAPHPTVHILREADVLAAVQSYPAASDIPGRNRCRLRGQGVNTCASRLQMCYMC